MQAWPLQRTGRQQDDDGLVGARPSFFLYCTNRARACAEPLYCIRRQDSLLKSTHAQERRLCECFFCFIALSSVRQYRKAATTIVQIEHVLRRTPAESLSVV